jgi:hypothetical protein
MPPGWWRPAQRWVTISMRAEWASSKSGADMRKNPITVSLASFLTGKTHRTVIECSGFNEGMLQVYEKS